MTAQTATMTDRDQVLHSIFTTALEGGIGYWSRCSEYRWSDGHGNESMDFLAVIEDEDGTEYRIDADVIRKGLREARKWVRATSRRDYHGRAIIGLSLNLPDTDFDSDTADMVVQFGLGLLSRDGGPMYE